MQHELTDRLIEANYSIRSFDWIGDGAKYWLRIVVRTPEARPVLLGNPIYINF